MSSQVAHDAQKGNKETVYVKMMASLLTPMKEWSEKMRRSYNENFSICNVELMENILPLLGPENIRGRCSRTIKRLLITDLLVMICSQNEGDCRPGVEQVKLSSNVSEEMRRLERERTAKNGSVKVPYDLPSQWISSLMDREEVSKWVATALVAIDRLAQLTQKLSASIMNQLQRHDATQKPVSINWDKYHMLLSSLPPKYMAACSNLLGAMFIPIKTGQQAKSLFSKSLHISELTMATEQPKPTAEDVKMDLFEDDDEFEEFAIDQEWEDKEEGKEVTQQWEDDWDDDDVNDDFSLQLRKELESNTEKK
ncbi:hypothetical protein K7X08_024470 [Anisodus acutangulus]|uniref:26S proteasome complex subunit SEM1 n=2 Tax=Anisodus TaxID=243963 RepID=A0A9Q1RF96_9SOLA|nr:hypothetical protein K7X08_024470 [Anisodus acutangulus]